MNELNEAVIYSVGTTQSPADYFDRELTPEEEDYLYTKVDMCTSCGWYLSVEELIVDIDSCEMICDECLENQE